MDLKTRDSERGQVLLVVVLVMVVFLVVGLSVASRSIFNVRTAVDEEKSQRAFSAAEAGIEQALKAIKNGQANSGFTIANQQLNPGDSSTQILKTTVTQVSSDQILLNNANQVLKDDGYDIWLSNYPDYSSPGTFDLTLYWGNPGISVCNDAALEVVVLKGTRSAPTIQRLTYDPCSSRTPSNSFSAPNGGQSVLLQKTFAYSQTLPHIVSGLIMRVIPLYAGSAIGVRSSNSISLPIQGSKISSTGVSGGTARQVSFFQGYPGLPTEFFPYILFSK